MWLEGHWEDWEHRKGLDGHMETRTMRPGHAWPVDATMDNGQTHRRNPCRVNHRQKFAEEDPKHLLENQ
jgi:hypothetical protein